MNRRLGVAVPLGLILAALAVVILVVQRTTRSDVQMNNTMLTCELEATPTGDGEITLAFNVHNPGSEPVNVRYLKPFIDFDLSAYADDGQVPLVQPAYDAGAQPVALSIPAGGTARIETPIRLRFDPNVGPAGGDVPTRWTLRHTPAPVRLRVTVRLSGATVSPCEVRVDPGAA